MRVADVYRPLILAAAHRYYLCHNHPSGRIEPSDEDLDLTRELYATGLSLGIVLSDHLVIGPGGRYRSLRAHGEGVMAWHREALWSRRRSAGRPAGHRVAETRSIGTRRQHLAICAQHGDRTTDSGVAAGNERDTPVELPGAEVFGRLEHRARTQA